MDDHSLTRRNTTSPSHHVRGSLTKRLGIYITVIEVIIIAILIVQVFATRQRNNTPVVSVTRMNSENFIKAPTSKLKHFLEFKPDQTIVYEEPWLPEVIKVPINSDGLIGPINYPLQKHTGVFRIVAIGDSFTKGSYVMHENTYPKQLETKLNTRMQCANISEFEVLNLGVRL